MLAIDIVDCSCSAYWRLDIQFAFQPIYSAERDRFEKNRKPDGFELGISRNSCSRDQRAGRSDKYIVEIKETVFAMQTSCKNYIVM